jgi:hypothetical protein
LLLCGDHALQLAIPHLLPLLAHLLQWPSLLLLLLLLGPHELQWRRLYQHVVSLLQTDQLFFSLTAQLPDQEVLWKVFSFKLVFFSFLLSNYHVIFLMTHDLVKQ